MTDIRDEYWELSEDQLKQKLYTLKGFEGSTRLKLEELQNTYNNVSNHLLAAQYVAMKRGVSW